MKKSLLFTGGGTTGHVTKNLILIRLLRELQPEMEFHYTGVTHGKEAQLVTPELAQFHPISSGKLRRYFSLQTIPDFFRFLWGLWQSFWLLGSLKPDLVFSSGGYVALPVAWAASLRRIPVITHETDSVPGLANRLIARVAKKVLLGYESAQSAFPKGKAVFVGNPVSPSLLRGSRERALERLDFEIGRPILLVMGGSQGAAEINQLIWQLLPQLLKDWQVIHLTGPGKQRDPQALDMPENGAYRTFEYVSEGYEDLLAAADLVVCRGGGNSMAEVAALGKRAIIIPLLSAAADHQTKNAQEMLRKHLSWRLLKSPKAKQLLEAIREPEKSGQREPKESGAAERIARLLLRELDF